MNHTTQTILGVLVVIAFVMGALFFYERSQKKEVSEEVPAPSEYQNTDQEPSLTSGDVEQYVTENISALSPEPEVLGGTYYVTSIEVADGTGVVSYEDGHVAYTADFTYSTAGGVVAIDSFVIRPQ